MAEEDAPAEADRVGHLPHPRETRALYGQSAAEASFLEAWGAGRLHHAWLLTGPRGIGKATLAYRIARRRLASDDGGGLLEAAAPPETLDLPADHAVARRVAAGAEPRLFTLRRMADAKTGKLATRIRVDDVRRLKSFFQLTATDGGWRVAIVDAAEEMNGAAANAILKLLEEPPPRALLLLVSHAPARLLPTIRSRCRTLRLSPLGPADLAAALADAGVAPADDLDALAILADGAAGEAARLVEADGPKLYRRLVRLIAGAPDMDRREMIAIADACAGREKAEMFDLTLRLMDILLARLARAGALGLASPAAPDEGAIFAKLAPDPAAARAWADLASGIQEKAARAQTVNLDPAMVMLDIFFMFDAAARKIRARPV
ncbi:DNA polymerase III subunit delta' [Pikeienuella sp. HZG-20]|uniref:DNA polymerase III subunit delta' n=1 Tax=Paludibacillus litoralis TaxID=3133267 RepID=UPI0030EF610E